MSVRHSQREYAVCPLRMQPPLVLLSLVVVVTFDHVHVGGGGCSVMPTTKLPDAQILCTFIRHNTFPASMASSNTKSSRLKQSIYDSKGVVYAHQVPRHLFFSYTCG